eukprot:m.33788 g.33788  ORF g.33788 m.33788 type:complete len:480 (+) comp31884_c0_seq7:404-1843(+)
MEPMQASDEDLCDVPITLPDVSWLPGMELGLGFDVLTGEIRPSPFRVKVKAVSKEVKIKPQRESQALHSEETFSLIETADDIEKELSISTNLSIRFGLFNSKLSADISKHVKCSEKSVTALRKKTITHDTYEMYEGSLELNEEAKSLLAENETKKFRDRYGDYYVAGLRRGSTFTAYYRCVASSKSELQQMKASLEASYSSISAKAETGARSESASSRSSVSISYTMAGTKGNYAKPVSSPEDVNEALTYFSSNCQGSPFLSFLKHYAFLNLGLEAQLPISPVAFQEMREIIHHVLDLEQKIKLQQTRVVRSKMYGFLKSFERFKHVLALSKSKRSALLREAEIITESLREVRLRIKFLSIVGSAVQPEQKIYGSLVECGFFPDSNIPEKIKNGTECATLTASPVKNAVIPLYFYDPEKIVIGWKVDQIGRGIDRMWTIVGDYLLKDEVKIDLTGQAGDVQLTVCYVNRSDFPLGEGEA